MTQFELGWVVGIFEGEGSILISKTPYKPTGHVTLSLYLEVSQEHKPVLERVQQIVGQGRIRHQSNKPWMHKWEVYSRKAETILEWLYPLLSIKKQVRAQNLLRQIDASRRTPRRVCSSILR